MDPKILKTLVPESDVNQLEVAKQLVEKWSRTKLLNKLSGHNKTNMAIMLQNQAMELKRLNESSAVADIAGFNKIAFPLVRRAFAQLIANDIVSIQPMSLPTGLLFYLDFQYERTKSGYSAGAPLYGTRESVYNSPAQGIGAQQAAGGYYELNSGYSTRSYQWTTSTVTGAAVSFALSATSPYISGALQGIDFTLANSAVADLLQLQNTRLVKFGEMTLGTETFRGLTAINSLTADSLYGTYDPTMTTFLSTGVVRFFANTTTIAAITGSTSAGATHVRVYGPVRTDLQDNPKSTVLGDFEAVTAIPEINIAISSVMVSAVTRKVKVKWTPELAQDIQAFHALDAEVELTTIMSEVIAMDIDREILGDLIHHAAVKMAWSRKIGRYVSLSADGYTISTNSFSNASNATSQAYYGTQHEWYQTLGEVMTAVSNEVHKRSLRAGCNFAVTSPEISTILESINGFKPSVIVDSTDVSYSFGVEKTGSLSNRWTIYKDPYFPANIILMGYKGGGWLETGFVYAPYVPLTVTPTIYGVEDFTPRKGVMTRGARQMVRPEFYGLVIVTDLDFIGNPHN